MKHQLILARNQTFNLYNYTPFNLISVNAHVEFLFQVTLLIKILTTRKFRRNFSSTFHVLFFNTLFALVTPLQSLSTKKEAHLSPQMSIRKHTTSSCLRFMTFCHYTSLRVTGTHSTRASLRNAVCLFTMAQSSPQPQSVDTANYARVNPLPSPATSSSSSGELHLYIDSDTSSPSVPTGSQSSSQEVLQGTI